MRTSMGRLVVLSGLLCGPVFGQAVFSAVPRTGTGNEITVTPGTSVVVDVFLSNTSPSKLQGYQAALPNAASGGIQGSVNHNGVVPVINTGRADYVFFGLGPFTAASLSPFPQVLGLLLNPASSPLVTTPKYGGEFTYNVSANALGNFTIDFQGREFGLTEMRDDWGNTIDFTQVPAIVHVICQNNAHCNDGLFCNGSETCVSGSCVAGTPPCPLPGLPFCDETLNACVECFGPADCSDGNQCTNDVCTLGNCSNPPFPLGTACGDPTNVECNGADTCNGSGSCRNNLSPDGTVCSDEGNDCTVDFCLSGVCSHPPRPSNTPCGDQSDTACDNPDRCNATGVCLPRHEAAGFPCGDPTNTVCNGADSCDGLGACDTHVQPDGTACTSDGNACTADVCNTGVCIHPNSPSGTPCGNPANTDCDNPDTCNGSGFCQSNPEVAGFPCGDPSDTDCTNPDTCNGAGACGPNNAPNGTVCNDQQFCTTGELCTNGLCGGGSATNCADAIPCTADSCNEGTDMCDHVLQPNKCLIAGICYDAGDPNPANECEVCNPAQSTSDWTTLADGAACNDDGNTCTGDECLAGVCDHPNLPPGTTCDDGNPCTGTGNPGVGVDECDGNGLCAGLLDPECADDCVNAVTAFDGVNTGTNVGFGPDEVEASCQPNSNHDAWFLYTALCDGDVMMTTDGSNFTPSNDTVLSVYDECGGTEIACDDDSGFELLSALVVFSATAGEDYFVRVAGFGDNVGAIQLNIIRLDTCYISGQCYADGAANPGSQCQLCDASVSNTAWSPRPIGTPCGTPGFSDCDSADACNAVGVCENNHKPDGIPCPADANQCTNDICLSGVCEHPFRPNGFACGDPTDTDCDNPDTCDGAGFCLDNLEAVGFACGDPTDTDCDNPDTCDGVGGCLDNLEPNGLACTDDGNDCTQDFCDVGVCIHPDEPVDTPCGDPADTDCDNPDTCDGGGTCLDNLEASGFACGDPADTDCDNPDTCNGGGVCLDNLEPDGLACTDDGNQCTLDFCDTGVCTHPNEPPGTACGSPVDTDCDNPDTCDGFGACLNNLEPFGFACGDGGNTDCDNPDTCDGGGDCMPNLESEGTSCTDDANDCTNDICATGICVHPNWPNGFACGDPSNSQCDHPDTCDGFGFCEDNLVLDDTPCNDVNVCTGPDTCQGGICDAPFIPQAPIVARNGPRSFKVTPQPAASGVSQALLVTSPTHPCLAKYIGATGQLTNTPFFQTPAMWGTVEAWGREVVPSSTYFVAAECGGDLSPTGSVIMPIWGDINGDGSVGLPDVFCVLDGYAADFSTCSFHQDDIHPCVPNGVINIFDIFSVLDAFEAIPYPCAAPCNGGACCKLGECSIAPSQSACQAGGGVYQGNGVDCVPVDPCPGLAPAPAGAGSDAASTITFVADQRRIGPGGLVKVDVFAEGVPDLRGYEISLEVSGARGRLEPTRAYIDTSRPDYVFTAMNGFTAVDEVGQRVLGGLLQGSASATERVYLGSFELRAPRGATGLFEVRALAEGTHLLDADGQPINATAVGASVSVGVRPARDADAIGRER